ncbi:hypothetical protein L6452_44018 [Arctium lappa]|uniref:Uncharacterized protein n=1 Tax=Arctium lappa TaxID=4217 RepID=A0ACB8XGC4_ARCLA|nr:hypothetical protein L6452_44018 [Arctium lappa]
MSTFSRSPFSPRRRLVFLRSMDLGMFGSIPVGSLENIDLSIRGELVGEDLRSQTILEVVRVTQGWETVAVSWISDYFSKLSVHTDIGVMCPKWAIIVSISVRTSWLIWIQLRVQRFFPEQNRSYNEEVTAKTVNKEKPDEQSTGRLVARLRPPRNPPGALLTHSGDLWRDLTRPVTRAEPCSSLKPDFQP